MPNMARGWLIRLWRIWLSPNLVPKSTEDWTPFRLVSWAIQVSNGGWCLFNQFRLQHLLQYKSQCGHELSISWCIGYSDSITAFTLSRTTEWTIHVSDIANNQAQVANTALTKSLQQQWLFFQSVTKNVSQLFQKMDNVLTSQFIPGLFSHTCTCSATERLLFSLPRQIGGLLSLYPHSH